MKDAAHHLKHVQKKVIQEARKEQANNNTNGIKLDESVNSFSLPFNKRPSNQHRSKKVV